MFHSRVLLLFKSVLMTFLGVKALKKAQKFAFIN